MSNNEAIYIIDDNEERCHKLSTILSFVGETCFHANYSNWQSQSYKDAQAIVAGVRSSYNDTIEFLSSATINAPPTGH